MLHSIKQRLEERALVAILIIPVGLCVFAFLSVAGYFAFRKSLPPDLAALAVAVCGLLLIFLILAVTRVIQAYRASTSRDRESKARQAGNNVRIGEELENYLESHVDSALADWVRKNPGKASIASFAVGIAAGYSKQFLHTLADLQAGESDSQSQSNPKRRRSGK